MYSYVSGTISMICNITLQILTNSSHLYSFINNSIFFKNLISIWYSVLNPLHNFYIIKTAQYINWCSTRRYSVTTTGNSFLQARFRVPLEQPKMKFTNKFATKFATKYVTFRIYQCDFFRKFHNRVHDSRSSFWATIQLPTFCRYTSFLQGTFFYYDIF